MAAVCDALVVNRKMIVFVSPVFPRIIQRLLFTLSGSTGIRRGREVDASVATIPDVRSAPSARGGGRCLRAWR